MVQGCKSACVIKPTPTMLLQVEGEDRKKVGEDTPHSEGQPLE